MPADFEKWSDAFDADAAGRSGPLAAIVRESNGNIPAFVIDRLARRIEQTRYKNTGRPKSWRDKTGSTPAQAAAARGYAIFHDALKHGAQPQAADAKAVNGNPQFAKVSKERREKIYRNGVTPINHVTRAIGTYVENAASLFVGF